MKMNNPTRPRQLLHSKRMESRNKTQPCQLKNRKHCTLQNIADTHSEVTFTVSNRGERDATINAAVISLRAAATTARSGILVTRRSPHLFTVTVSQNVPFGLTREVDEAPCSENHDGLKPRGNPALGL